MANLKDQQKSDDAPPSRLRITRFEIIGLFGGKKIEFPFPDPQSSDEPAIIILSGSNGIGKTTILRMIGGILNLNFDEFRRVPFIKARMHFSDENKLEVESTEDPKRPIRVLYDSLKMGLAADRSFEYSKQERDKIDAFKEVALPRFRGVRYELLELDRSLQQKLQNDDSIYFDSTGRAVKRQNKESTLAAKIRVFLRDAQVNHRRFFRSEELDVLPRLIDRLSAESKAPTVDELLGRVKEIVLKAPLYERLGLYVDEEQLASLADLIGSDRSWTPQQLSLIETYVEMQEGMQQARELISNRLLEFEKTMASFLIGKSVEIDRREGMIIKSRGQLLTESQLSSGEYHFLYMMVTALLCQRIGTIIAIDEPELSLHVSWQRRIVRALSRCAAGASPLFIFATHSLAISAEYSKHIVRLSDVD